MIKWDSRFWLKTPFKGPVAYSLFASAYSPSSTCYEDTYNTLKYADRAKNIKSDLKSNVISVDFHVSKYAKIVEELKQQVRYDIYDILFFCVIETWILCNMSKK